MSDFHAAYPEYAATSALDDLRATEYGYLDEAGHVYLDYAGAGLASRAQLRAHAARMYANCYGNPHSDSPASAASTRLIAQARRKVLRFVGASPEEYAVIFTPNATGACRLVAEAYPFHRSSRFVLTADNHNSVNGMREFARAGGARVTYVPLSQPDLRATEEDLDRALARGYGVRAGLFAYPAQSNFSGVRHPLRWVAHAQSAGYDVLLDAAAFLPTCPLDLTVVRPEFVVVSWYKVFGYPTGVGCLLARRDALARLHRPWFSGGTVRSASVRDDWHRLLDGEAAFEDGTVNFLSIPDVTTGLEWISGVGPELITLRVSILTRWLLQSLGRLKHGNGEPLARIHGPVTGAGRGGTVALSFLDPSGVPVDERIVVRNAMAAKISLRTGCFCNPGAGEAALGGGALPPSAGAVRVSLGVASTLGDVEAFLDFAERAYRDRYIRGAALPSRASC
ncbi:MAG: aminotransferase class V-fold PLP-dependent enzyme [Nocardiopsaceae bacterium]|nr:aminotransferase class V-fold PLP-dependent enzyme [Nocardiopsaceae bacterium]